MSKNSKVTFKAATPHPLNLVIEGERIILPPRENAPRIDQLPELAGEIGGMKISRVSRGKIVNMPGREEGVVWLVGLAFVGHPDLAGRDDVMAIDTQRGVIREEREGGLPPQVWVTQLIDIGGETHSSNGYEAEIERLSKIAQVLGNPANEAEAQMALDDAIAAEIERLEADIEDEVAELKNKLATVTQTNIRLLKTVSDQARVMRDAVNHAPKRVEVKTLVQEFTIESDIRIADIALAKYLNEGWAVMHMVIQGNSTISRFVRQVVMQRPVAGFSPNGKHEKAEAEVEADESPTEEEIVPETMQEAMAAGASAEVVKTLGNQQAMDKAWETYHQMVRAHKERSGTLALQGARDAAKRVEVDGDTVLIVDDHLDNSVKFPAGIDPESISYSEAIQNPRLGAEHLAYIRKRDAGVIDKYHALREQILSTPEVTHVQS